MTLREALAHHYPLHFQRIVECVHESERVNEISNADRYLDSRWVGPALSGAFQWSNTTEGHKYWRALSRAEGSTHTLD